MNDVLQKSHVEIRCLLSREDGQDLIDYALTASLIAMAVTAGMNTLATGIDNGFATWAHL